MQRYPQNKTARKTEIKLKRGGELLTNEELILQYYSGDETVLEKLYHKNIGFIRDIAKEVAVSFNCYKKNSEHSNKITPYTKDILEELHNEGVLEFFSCLRAKEYDPNRAKLTTYLYPRLKGAMYRWMESNLGVLSVESRTMAELRKVQELYFSVGKEPKEIAEELGITIAAVNRHISYNTHFLSVYDLVPTEQDEPCDPFEYLMPYKLIAPPDRIVYRKICLELLKELFESLPKKDKHILGHSYGAFGYKQKDLDTLSLEQMMTVDGIIKARKAALRKMKENYPNSKLRLWKTVYRTVMREAEKYTD